MNIDVRLCKECQSTLFSHRDFETDRLERRADVRTYENLLQFERGIRLLLPKFQKLLTALQYGLEYVNSILYFTDACASQRPKSATYTTATTRCSEDSEKADGFLCPV